MHRPEGVHHTWLFDSDEDLLGFLLWPSCWLSGIYLGKSISRKQTSLCVFYRKRSTQSFPVPSPWVVKEAWPICTSGSNSKIRPCVMLGRSQLPWALFPQLWIQGLEQAALLSLLPFLMHSFTLNQYFWSMDDVLWIAPSAGKYSSDLRHSPCLQSRKIFSKLSLCPRHSAAASCQCCCHFRHFSF